jgi:hypothetical protein
LKTLTVTEENRLAEQLSLNDILLSKKKFTIQYHPYCHFVVDNFLPKEVYECLLKNFPSEDAFQYQADNKALLGTRYGEEIFKTFSDEHDLWRKFLELMSSQEFIIDFQRTIKRGVISSRGWQGFSAWKLAHTLSRKFIKNKWKRRFSFVQPINISCSFSRMMTGNEALPHTDVPRKLGTFLIFFPSKDWKKSYGGDLNFYYPKSKALAKKWSNWNSAHIGDMHQKDNFYKDMKKIFCAEFLPNRLVVLIKTDLSYHVVRPLKSLEGMGRHALNLNIDLVR